MEGKVLCFFPNFTLDFVLLLSCTLSSLHYQILLLWAFGEVLSADHYSVIIFFALNYPHLSLYLTVLDTKHPKLLEALICHWDLAAVARFYQHVKLSGVETGMWVLLVAVLIISERNDYFPSSVVCQ